MHGLGERRLVREALDVLAQILGEEPVLVDESGVRQGPSGPELVVEARGRRWVMDVRAKAGPGLVSDAAEQVGRWIDLLPAGHEAVGLVVVPYMGAAGQDVAAAEGVSWLDLSGNADIRQGDLYIHVEGRPNRYVSRGRPSTPFAPKSSRIAHLLLRDPSAWWRQADLAERSGLDDGQVSRVVRRLIDDRLVERHDGTLRPIDPGRLLDAWAEHYRFDRHEVVLGHLTGSAEELVRSISHGATAGRIHHAFTGFPAAWAYDGFAAFRLVSLYVEGDPVAVADRLEVRRGDRGANVQLIAPDDHEAVWLSQRSVGELSCVAPFQAYLDLQHLPERSREAAEHLRSSRLWDG